jgi:pimeloyl-ACP methyl ester carboxylesterase
MSTNDRRIAITVDDGSQIAGTMVTPAVTVPGVLFVHGWGGSQEQYLARAREIAALGCISLTFDLRGHAGDKDEQETVSRENNFNDVLAAYDLLANHINVDASAIAVVGSSYGGYLASILTSVRKVRWMALRVPALYMDSDWDMPKRQLHRDQDLDKLRNRLVPAAENRALRACTKFAGDVLVVESERDVIVPHAAITSYLEACSHAQSLTYRVIKDADHGLSTESSQRAYTALLMNWLTEMVFGSRVGNLAPAHNSGLSMHLPHGPERPG